MNIETKHWRGGAQAGDNKLPTGVAIAGLGVGFYDCPITDERVFYSDQPFIVSGFNSEKISADLFAEIKDAICEAKIQAAADTGAE